MGGRKCGSRTDGIIIPAHPQLRCTHVRCTLITTHHTQPTHEHSTAYSSFHLTVSLKYKIEVKLYTFKNVKTFQILSLLYWQQAFYHRSDVMKCVLRVESGESRLQHSPAASRNRFRCSLSLSQWKIEHSSDQPQLQQLETKSGWGLIPPSCVQNILMW